MLGMKRLVSVEAHVPARDHKGWATFGTGAAALGLVITLVALVIAACGGDDDKPGTGALDGSPGGRADLSDMSLVYIDSRDSTAQVFVAKHDGSDGKKLANLPQGARPLDLRAGVLLAGDGEQLVLLDLRDGKTVDLKPNGTVTDARFIDDGTIVFATSAGCSGNGKVKTTLQTLALKDGAKKEVTTTESGSLTIAGVAKDGTVAIVPRGCDVGVSEVQTVNAKASATPDVERTQTLGCGWATAAPELKTAVVSWKSCTPPESKTGIDATIYTLGPNQKPPLDIKSPAGGANPSPWLIRPGRSEAVLATAETSGTGPDASKSTGLWVVDLTSGQVRGLAPAAGQEQFPVSWTPEGRYLLAASVQAQGNCSYLIVDAVDKKVTALPDSITFCGPNGQVLGWTLVAK